MPYPRVVPHSDAAGVVDAVGEGVDPARIGRRVWVYGAQSYRAGPRSSVDVMGEFSRCRSVWPVETS